MRIFLLPFLLIANISFGQINLNQGLIAHYPFTGNANDVSGNNINGVVNNATLTSDRFNQPNSAYYFNGSSSYIQLPYSPLYNFAPQDSFSISVRVLPDQGYSWPAQAVVVKSPFHPSYTLSLWNYGVYVLDYKAMGGFAYNNIVRGTTTFTGTACWYNIIITYKNGIWKLYVDGILESSDMTQTKFILQDGAASRINFGRKGDSNGDWYKGKMDDIRIYNRVLNAAEINTLTDCATSTNCSNWLNTPAPNSNARIGDLDIPGNQLTVEANFIRTGPVNPVGGYGFLVSKHITVGDINYALWPGGCAISTVNGDVWAQEACPFQLNKTYHVAMVYDGAFLKFYRNGFLQSQTPASGNLIQNNYLTTIAQNVPEAAPTIYPFIGYMNEVRIWNVARTQVELQTYMNASLPNPTTQTGLKGYYVFDNLLNKQGNTAFNATLNGAAAINGTNPNCTFSPDPGLTASAGNDSSYCTNSTITHQLQGSGTGNYSWSPAAYLNNPNIQNPVATISSTTTFYLTVSTASSSTCSAVDSVTIYINPLPVIQTLSDTAICQNAALVLTTTSNATTYQWSPASYVNNPGAANPAFIGPSSLRMYVTGSTGPGCSSVDSVDVTVKPAPIINTINDTTLCINQTVTLTTTGGQSYSWSPATGLSNPNIANPVFSGNTGRTYTVTGIGSNSCPGTDMVRIDISSPASLKQPPSFTACQKQTVQLDGNNGTWYSYLWSPATYLSSATAINPWANPPQTTLYTVVVTDSRCGFDSSFTTLLTLVPAPVINARKSNDIDCALRSATLFASGGNQYLWSPASGLSNITIANPVATPTVTQTYKVLVVDANGCSNTDSVTVFANYSGSLARFMPNAFTPNGDGLNDCYGLKNWLFVRNLQFFIFNRYGEQVFATSNPANCWDGTFKGKPALAGTYVFVIKANTDCGTEEQKGSFVLIR